jgi:hypothetical protein
MPAYAWLALTSTTIKIMMMNTESEIIFFILRAFFHSWISIHGPGLMPFKQIFNSGLIDYTKLPPN